MFSTESELGHLCRNAFSIESELSHLCLNAFSIESELGHLCWNAFSLSPFLIGRMYLREPSWKYSAKLVGS